MLTLVKVRLNKSVKLAPISKLLLIAKEPPLGVKLKTFGRVVSTALKVLVSV